MPVGRVRGQAPAAGSLVSSGTPIDLVISIGPATAQTFYVDADGAGVVQDGTQQHPFDTIGEAVDATEHGRGDTIRVAPGVYAEAVELKLDTILLGVQGAYHTHLMSAKISGNVVSGPDGCVIRGFTIGNAAASAVDVPPWASVEVTNCVLHSSVNGLRAGAGAEVVFVNNTVVSNTYGLRADADGVFSLLRNNIIDSNGTGVAGDADAVAVGGYNDYFENDTDLEGPASSATDLAVDPAFVDAASLNFHLRATSLVRNSGDPSAAQNDKDGSRNDLGADGGPNGVTDTLPPFASITADVSDGDAPLTVNFSAASSSDEWGIASYTWDFDIRDGLGNDAQGATVQHTFTERAPYTVTLMLEDNSGLTANATTSIAVGVITVTAWADTIAGRAPLDVQFHAVANGSYTGPVVFEWDSNGDGVADFQGPNPLRRFSTAMMENYVITVTATDADENWAQDTVRVAVLEADPDDVELVEPGIGAELVVDDAGSEIDGTTVTIPAGALSEPYVIAVSSVMNPPAVSPEFLGVPIELTPEGLTFSQPVTVTFTHPSTTAHPVEVEVRYYDSATGTWSDEGISNVVHVSGTPNDTVSFDTTHFTIFGVMGALENADVNLDAQVNAVDVQLVINAALGLPTAYPRTDVNDDGSTDAVDVQLVINGALGLK